MTRPLRAEQRKPTLASSDLPVFDADGFRRRKEQIVAGGAPEAFLRFLRISAPEADAEQLIVKLFDAYERAANVTLAMAQFRGPAAARAAAVRRRLDLILEMLRELEQPGNDVPDAAVSQMVSALRGAAAPTIGLDLDRLIIAVIAERERHAMAIRQLDGRGRPPTRLRALGDQLRPIFVRYAAPDRSSRADFKVFLMQAAELVTGTKVSEALAGGVARRLIDGC